ncbi:hypothetical protein IU486_19945 [Streptomyces gardneri]|uniref:hypothetical protein n=1 Tax=Nocardia abscessus TaxID=120957 RepID=UPI0018933BF7|nr:hypothetical protein [Nocardia abscessus]MBF6167003.1 hypothetical protein [Streptomyces gardneri]MBF6475303.1 hypothetical protein [Nocardia abscessus]
MFALHYAVRRLSTQRVGVAAVLLALVLIATNAPALVSLGLLCSVLAILIVGETVVHMPSRARPGHAMA